MNPPATTTALVALAGMTTALGVLLARRFARPGTYAYICALHPGMTGKIVVR